MNYFKGYNKKKGKNGGLTKYVGDFTKSALTFGLGSSIVSQPQFGPIGQQGAQGLAAGAQFFPVIGVTLGAKRALKEVKKLRRAF